MILALSRFRVKHGRAAEVCEAFVRRPRQVEGTAGFQGLEVYADRRDDGAFLLLTRWADEAAFRAWHASPSHHASHALMPPGLKLDPAGTELIVATRVDGASSGAAVGELLSDHSTMLARFVDEGATLCVVELDEGARIVRATASFEAVVGAKVIGRELLDLVDPCRVEDFRRRLADRADAGPFTAHFLESSGQPFSLRCMLRRTSDGTVLLAEPAWDDHRALERQLFETNGELAVLSRENARQARALEAALRDLKEANWRLTKISEVLPMCLSCREVKTGPGPEDWEAVETFLEKNSTFLSHGYCARCERRLDDSAEGELP